MKLSVVNGPGKCLGEKNPRELQPAPANHACAARKSLYDERKINKETANLHSFRDMHHDAEVEERKERRWKKRRERGGTKIIPTGPIKTDVSSPYVLTTFSRLTRFGWKSCDVGTKRRDLRENVGEEGDVPGRRKTTQAGGAQSWAFDLSLSLKPFLENKTAAPPVL